MITAKFEELDIRLDFPETQCSSNHSGILCGGCRAGLSLALGTFQCLWCSIKHIALLIPFAIAGIVLVAFIKLLNLTASEGTPNGLIFYANISGANEATFFPSTSKRCPVLTVFIAWLNLDLGSSWDLLHWWIEWLLEDMATVCLPCLYLDHYWYHDYCCTLLFNGCKILW